jgi:regulation of enolase protein 1 (concanavalin A-like superfamily)
MLRLSADCWLKTSVEFEPAEPHNRLGAVVTNGGYSDWSTQPLSKSVGCVWFRIRAETRAVLVEHSLDGSSWEQLRMAHLSERTPSSVVECGLYCCSPKHAGYRADFHRLDFEPSP